MKFRVWVIFISVTSALAAGGAWLYFSKASHQPTEREMTCLSALIPSIVLHYEQEEIVQLLNDLANENKENIPDNLNAEPVKPVFNTRLDKELLQIAKYFSIRNDNPMMEQADVIPSVTRALQMFKSDSPKYLNTCLTYLGDAEKDCGTIENPNAQQQLCLEKHSEKINHLVREWF